LGCYNNLLSSLDVRGLNNLQSLNTQSNPLLICISVDDVAYATSNYTKDATTIFSTNCNGGLYTAIPDANFEQALFDLGIDTVNGDHQVLTAAVSEVTQLDVSTKNIADLTGIQAFTNLQVLYCSYNSLSSLDVSANTALISLYCSNNSLSSLNVTANTALIELLCSNNLLSSLNVIANTALTVLSCQNNQLSSLDVSLNTALQYFFCDNNSISSLDVSENTALINLGCASNSLSSLNVSANTALTDLRCFDNSLSSLNVSANTALNYFDCTINSLNSLDVTANTALTRLFCANNSLSSLNVNANTALTDLYCSNNPLSSLDVSANTALTGLYCSDNSLSSLDVSANTALTQLVCTDNSLSSLDVSANTLLTGLYCRNNSLSSLDVRGLNNLQQLNTQFNPLLSCVSVDDVAYATSNSYYYKDAITIFSTNCSGLFTAIPDANFEQALFDLGIDNINGDHKVLTAAVSGVTNLNVSSKNIADLTGIQAFTNLQVLNCASNSLISLDVSGNTALQILNCSDNLLSSLDVSANLALHYLGCDNNSLSSLNVITNTALQSLYCYNNSISSLDVSENTALIELFCDGNSLISLDVSENTALQILNCSDNSLISLNVSANTALTNLYCQNNSLSSLDVRGLNHLQTLSTVYNPLLSCISVNDVAYATSNYLKDAATIFLTNCNVIYGSTAAVLSGSTTICSGNSATMSVAITGGSSPYTVVYSNGVSNITVTDYVSGTAISVSPTTSTTYTLVSVTDADSNLGTGNSGTADITVNANPATPSASAQTLTFNATVADLLATGTNLQWYDSATGGSSLATSTQLATGTYYVSQTNNGCESTRTAVPVTISFLPIVTSSLTYCKGATAIPLSAVGASGSTLRWYTVATGGTGSLIAPTPVTTAIGTRNFYVSQTVNGVESARAMITVIVIALPTTPGVITGTTSQGVLVGTTNTATYSIAPVAGATSYEWTVPTGVTIIDGQGTTSIVVNFNGVPAGAGTIGNITVQSVIASGCKSTIRSITITKTLPSAPAKLIMSNGVTATAITSFAIYMGTNTELKLTAATVASATSYEWELPTGVNRTDGSGTNTTVPYIFVNFLGVTSANTLTDASTNVLRIGVKSRNGVGVSTTNNAALINPTTSSTAKQLTLTAVRPAAVSAVTGQISGLCGGRTYEYTITKASPWASSYEITAPTGSVVTSASNPSNILNTLITSDLTFTVTYPAGFTINTTTATANKSIIITASNGIGNSITSRVVKLATALGAIGAHTNSYSFTPSGGGTVSALYFTKCVAQTISVPVVPNATSYVWTLQNGATGSSSNNSIVIDFSGVSTTLSPITKNIVKVKAYNGCTYSAEKSITLTWDRITICGPRMANPNISSTITVYPNPTSSMLFIESSNNSTIDNLIVMDLLGKVIYEGKPENNQLNVEGFASGTYILQAFSGEEKFTKKFIKE
jgi:Leucine-rich repeat (LRR) protein